MSLSLSILYRGPLSSCNYDCSYCPFAKHWESPEELQRDQAALLRFQAWFADRADDNFAVFFTPWGEALVRAWYRDAIVAMSRLPNVRKVAVQTNLSCSLDWLADADTQKIGLWCTYHPQQTTLGSFLAQCRRLDRLGIRYSVGCVGLQEYRDEIVQLREALPRNIYLWINAFKDVPDYYDEQSLGFMASIDPLFPVNHQDHASQGRSCRCGSSVFSVDGDGNMRRCHFIDKVIGNIYEPNFDAALTHDRCSNRNCGCHIGYVHLEHLRLYDVFGDGVLERIPEAHAQLR